MCSLVCGLKQDFLVIRTVLVIRRICDCLQNKTVKNSNGLLNFVCSVDYDEILLQEFSETMQGKPPYKTYCIGCRKHEKRLAFDVEFYVKETKFRIS